MKGVICMLKGSKWRFQEISLAALLVSLWAVLSVYSLPLKIIMHEGYFPGFYFLIWITGFLFTPRKAFLTTFIGHFFFDLIYLPNPLFIFVWFASACFAATVSVLKTHLKLKPLLYLLPPFYYLGAFFIMGYIQYNHPFTYFFVYPGVSLMLLIGNPLFNVLVAQIMQRRPRLFAFLITQFAPNDNVAIIDPIRKAQAKERHWTASQKRHLSTQLIGLLTLMVVTCGTILGLYYRPTAPLKPQVFVVLSGPTAYTDKAFNQLSLNGVCQKFAINPSTCQISNPRFRQKIAYGFPNTLVNSQRIYEYIQTIATTKQSKIFVLPGYNFTPFLTRYIRKLEQKNLKMIGITTDYQLPTAETWPTNLFQFKFQEQKAGYMAGLYAGLFALLNPTQFKDANPNLAGIQIKFASIGILMVPAVVAFGLGFKAGIDFIQTHKKTLWNAAQTANVPLTSPYAVEQIDLYHDGFKIIDGTDFQIKSGEALQLAKQLYQAQASVIFSIASPFTTSIQEQAVIENYLSKTRQHWVVGVDVDQGYALFNQTGWKSQAQIITSALIDIVRQVKKGLDYIIDQKTIPTKEYVETALAAFQVPARYRVADNPVWSVWTAKRALLEDQAYIAQMTNKVNRLIKTDLVQSSRLLRDKTPWSNN